MKKGLTEIIMILDRSGSMYPLVDDTIGGFNTFLSDQQSLPGEALMTLVLFDNQYDVLFSGRPIKEVKPLDKKTYFTRGMTALVDAIGKTVDDVGLRLANTQESERPEKVIVVIVTDGAENASKEYTKKQVKEKVVRQTQEYNWEFLYWGANVDAFAEAGALGIKDFNTRSYEATDTGTKAMYGSAGASVMSLRANSGNKEDKNGQEAKKR